MIPAPTHHDTASRQLLSGVTIAANTSAPAALEQVLDSLMVHPNMAPFIGKQLIQHLVSSNPTPAYVARVASAFTAGKFTDAASGLSFGTGQNGDLAATVAAVLLDAEARSATPLRTAGKLREPIQMFTGVLRAMGGQTDGEVFGWWWGNVLNQHVFRPPSVFNFYPPDYPVAGTNLVGPTFGIHSASTALDRLNYLTHLLYWRGSFPPSASVPNAVGTDVDWTLFSGDVDDPAKLVDRLSLIALGQPLPSGPRNKVIEAVAALTAANDPTAWQLNRIAVAAHLVFSSPNYQVLR